MAIRQTFDISFYCRASKADKNGYSPVELSIIINGERVYLNLQRKEKPDEFKDALNSKKTNPVKSFCENQRRLIDDYVEQMAFAGVELTAANLKECLKRGYVCQQYSLGDMWRDIIDNERLKLKVGDIGETTFKKYYLAKAAFYDANGFTDAVPAHSVDIQHINAYQFYLRDSGKEQSTVYNYQSRVKSAFTLAFNRGKIKSNPYAGFQMDKGDKKPIVWLTEAELKTIAAADVHIERLARVRDLFLFQCYSGLSFSDMAQLAKDDFKKDKASGQIYIEKQRVKTGERFFSMILAEGEAILKRYDYQLPCITNQKFNSYLKELQDICKIEKVFHSHLGRTTYVCYLYNKGVEPQKIAKMVGHSTAETTLKYYAEMDKATLIEAIQAIDGKTKKGVKIAGQGAAVIQRINGYFNDTLFIEGNPVLSNQELVGREDEIVSQLVSLKQDKLTYDEYRVAFAKCCSTLKSRLAFSRRKIVEEESNGNNASVSKIRQLQKSYRRFYKTLEGLDERLFKLCSK